MRLEHIPETIEDAVKDWDADKTVWSAEMGGLGPGYEQAIQIGIFELSKDLIGKEFPPSSDTDQALEEFLHNALSATIKRLSPVLDGLSGAQAGAIISTAYRFKKSGYRASLQTLSDDRLIQVDRKFPSLT